MADFKPVELNLDTDALVTEWAKYTVHHLYEALNNYDISISGPLFRSIQNELTRNGGHIEKVLTKFFQYGRFLDMGVGRGVPIGAAGTSAFSAARNDNGSLKSYRRKAKKWFSKSYYADVQRFKELYIRTFNNQIPIQIGAALTAQVNLAA